MYNAETPLSSQELRVARSLTCFGADFGAIAVRVAA